MLSICDLINVRIYEKLKILEFIKKIYYLLKTRSFVCEGKGTFLQLNTRIEYSY